jgi:IS1 family transposase
MMVLDRIGKHTIYKIAMNKLSLAKRVQILSMLCEGASLRSVSRVADVSLNTVTKLLIDAGVACAIYHDEHVRNVKAQRIQCDEIWSFVAVKARNRAASIHSTDPTAGDCWTWTAIESETKLLISYMVGSRDAEFALILMDDLRRRLATRVQLTTDGHSSYLSAVDEAFGDSIDYAMLIKLYGEPSRSREASRRYSPADCIGTRTQKISGNPNPEFISTSYAERHNLTMRMAMRRFTRLTNAFSKKIENHYHAVALHVMFYNYVRIHKTLRVTPAMASGLTDRLWSMEDIVTLIDEREGPPKKRGPYKPRQQKFEDQISN